MAKVYAFLADGSEEVECLAVVDVLRRAGIETELVSINPDKEIKGSHGIRIICDSTAEGRDFSDADVLFLPGGMPGTINLMNCAVVSEALDMQYHRGGRIAAICAAPSIPGAKGFLDGKKATCFPGFEDKLGAAEYTGAGVVTDGNMTTARGLGYALDLGLEITALLLGKEQAARIKSSIQYDR